MFYVELTGWAAAIATLLAYSQRTMLPLRVAAVTANVFFIAYGYLAHIPPTLVLHCVLLPFNAYRLWEIYSQTAKVKAARSGEADALDWIRGVVQPRPFADGEVIFSRGDPPSHLYYLQSGEVLLEEIGVTLEPGTVFGEIAFFTSARERTQTARCVGPCQIMALDEAEFMRAYYRNPAFGMYIVRLVAERLIDTSRRKQETS